MMNDGAVIRTRAILGERVAFSQGTSSAAANLPHSSGVHFGRGTVAALPARGMLLGLALLK